MKSLVINLRLFGLHIPSLLLYLMDHRGSGALNNGLDDDDNGIEQFSAPGN
jgi:hypothetical protein